MCSLSRHGEHLTFPQAALRDHSAGILEFHSTLMYFATVALEVPVIFVRLMLTLIIAMIALAITGHSQGDRPPREIEELYAVKDRTITPTS